MLKKFALTTGAMMMCATVATADLLALGSTATGGTSQIGRALAAVVSEVSPHQMRPQEVANTSDYIPLVNAGELEFGIANVVQTFYGKTGTGMSEGRPNDNLLMAATLMPFRAAFIVPVDSDVTSVMDLRGKRVPSFSEGTLGYHVVNAYLANAGLTEADIVPVPVPNFPRMWASFSEGSTDVTVVVVGAANAREFDATMGGIRYLDFDEDEAAVTRMNEFLPQMYLSRLDADANIPGINDPTDIMVYDYTLFTSTATSDEHVYETVKAIYESQETLLRAGPFFSGFEPNDMSKDVSIEYHPGAIRFFEEVGIWNR